MKVIKEGRKQKGFSLELACTGSGNGGGGCGAELLVEEPDFYTTSSSVHVDTTYYTTFMCPECGVETDVSPSKVVGRARSFPSKSASERAKQREAIRESRG